MGATVNKAELGQSLKVSQPTIDRWLLVGMPVKTHGKNGVAYEFDLDEVIEWRKRVDQDEAEVEAERRRQIEERQAEMFAGEQLAPVGFDIARHREAMAAERDAITLSKLKGGLIEVEDARRTTDAVIGIIRQRLLAFVPNLTRAAGLTPEQQQEGDKQVRALLEDIRLAIREWTPSTSTDSASALSAPRMPNGAPPAIS